MLYKLFNLIFSFCVILEFSDGWKAYVGIDQHGFTHQVVNHSKEFVNSKVLCCNKCSNIATRY